jgi:hypothetical protein
MTAIVTGLDLAEAMASVPEECDGALARRLLIVAEIPFVAAWREAAKTPDNTDV